MKKAMREVGGFGELGDRRYERYVDAFDWVEKCYREGYYLEAIAVLDSIINERLSSRLAYITGKDIDSSLTTGKLCQDLVGDDAKNVGFESNADFRAAITNIKCWVKMRNEAMHATAKLLRDDKTREAFSEILKRHGQAVVDGIDRLRAFDELDTTDRARVGKYPASYPYAFFPTKRIGG